MTSRHDVREYVLSKIAEGDDASKIYLLLMGACAHMKHTPSRDGFALLLEEVLDARAARFPGVPLIEVSRVDWGRT